MTDKDESWKDKIITPRVGVAGVVFRAETLITKSQVLMIRRVYPPHGIAFPGGFQEVGETVAQTAIRETKEETNIDAAAHGLIRINTMPHTDPRFHVTALYVYMTPNNYAIKEGDDAKEAFWMNLDDRSYEHEMSNTTVSLLNYLRKGDINTIPLG